MSFQLEGDFKDPSQYFSAYGGEIEIFIEFPATFAVIHSVKSRES